MSTSGTSVTFSPPIASGLWYNKPFYLASGTNVTSTAQLTDSNSYRGIYVNKDNLFKECSNQDS